ncbi:MAG TPA: hypothetical protein VGK79_13290 [Gaiellaceae bacterium]
MTDHRALGVELFNRTWSLLEKNDRTADEDAELIHCAHASAHHWLQIGTAANRARSEWQCARVHAVLGQSEQALYHARRCLRLVEEHPDEMDDWDLAAAYEALARAHLAAGESGEAAGYAALARDATAAIADEEDRALIEADLATIRV